MGYNQHIQLRITNRSKSVTYTLKNPKLSWGKFYDNPNKDNELQLDNPKINGYDIKPQQATVVASCGRSDSASGTEGSIEIWDGSTKVGWIGWNNPWAAGAANSCNATLEGGDTSDYTISLGTCAQGASIGLIEATISKVA